jgi:Leucine-rich repeat (LRR) protein
MFKLLSLLVIFISNVHLSQTKYYTKKEALKAVKKNGLEIKYVVESYRNDKEVVVEAFLNNTRIKELYEIDLEILDLATKKLYVLYKSLSNDLLYPEKLESLDLSDYDLTEIPPIISALNHLKFLDLSGNLISTLPEELGKLKNLETLNLTGNRITNLETISRMLPNTQIIGGN